MGVAGAVNLTVGGFSSDRFQSEQIRLVLGKQALKLVAGPVGHLVRFKRFEIRR